MLSLLSRLSRLVHEKDAPPEVVFDRIIDERQRRYAELKQAAVKILFLRNQLAGDLLERRAEVARLHSEARTAARTRRDERALTMLERMNQKKERLAHAEEQLEAIKRESQEIAVDLARLGDSIRDLRDEKRETVAKLTSAEVRRKVRAILSQTDLELERLERVRAVVERASAEARLDLEDDASRLALADPAARIELARLKAKLLPV